MARRLPRLPCWLVVLAFAAVGFSLSEPGSAQDRKPGLVHYADPEGAVAGAAGEAEDVILLKATFGLDGVATQVDAIRGPKRLRPLAIGAVRRWRYVPAGNEPDTILIGMNVARTTGGWQPEKQRRWPAHTREPWTAPNRVVDARPVYPPQARRKGIEGMVIGQAILDAEGRVASAYLLRGVEGLNEAALETFLRWRYERGKGDYTFPLQMSVMVTFRLP
jgi:TonB family protein